MRGTDLRTVTQKIIEELSVRNIKVKGIVSDMSPSNQSMWKSADIKNKRSVTMYFPLSINVLF